MYNVETILVPCMSDPLTDSQHLLTLFPTTLQKKKKKKKKMVASFLIGNKPD